MKENEFILFSAGSLEELKLKIEAVKDFTLMIHSQRSHRIIDNTDQHIPNKDDWCFALDKAWDKYNVTFDRIFTCIRDFMKGYNYRIEEEVKSFCERSTRKRRTKK